MKKPTEETEKKNTIFFFDFGIIFQMTFRPTYNCSIAKIPKLGER